jgi:hypothetical protein
VDCAGDFQAGGRWLDQFVVAVVGGGGRCLRWEFVVGGSGGRGDDASLQEDLAVLVCFARAAGRGCGCGSVGGWCGAACGRVEAAAVGLHLFVFVDCWK